MRVQNVTGINYYNNKTSNVRSYRVNEVLCQPSEVNQIAFKSTLGKIFKVGAAVTMGAAGAIVGFCVGGPFGAGVGATAGAKLGADSVEDRDDSAEDPNNQ